MKEKEMRIPGSKHRALMRARVFIDHSFDVA
jgi:hypothetical protein